MRIGFDISQIAHPGGVATYTENLTKELSSCADLDMVYFYSSLRKPYKGNLTPVKSYLIPPTIAEPVFNNLRFPIEWLIGDVNIFHSSDWIQPKTNAKKVTTYHDVVPLKYPEWSHPKIVEVHKKRLKLVEEEVDLVIAVSEATKKDLLEVSNIREDKIVVIYEAPTAEFKKVGVSEINKFKEKYQLPDKFVLAIGGIGERRNLERIKEATKDRNLVIAGVTLPWLGIEELGMLYQCADLLLYPSLYEGFGIPILDAFLTGTPVITSNVSSMPEVGGDAALYVDPKNVDDIKEKVNALSKNNDMKEKLIKKGFEQVKDFSWSKAAKETAKSYKRLL